jgi:arylsulfatase A-like enzyme
MFARWVGTLPAGRVSDHPWAHWDIMPTLAELTCARAPKGIDGMSMVRALRGEAQTTHDFFYWEFHERRFQQPFGWAGGRRCGSAWASRSSYRASTPTRARNAMSQPPTRRWSNAQSRICGRRARCRSCGRMGTNELLSHVTLSHSSDAAKVLSARSDG